MGWTVTGVRRSISGTALAASIALVMGCVSPDRALMDDPAAPPQEDEAAVAPDRSEEPPPADDREDRTPPDPTPPESLPPDPEGDSDPNLAVTPDLPQLPPRRVVPVPPTTATPDQLARIRDYYGIRSAPEVPIAGTVQPIIDAPAVALRYAQQGLVQGGLRVANTSTSGNAPMSGSTEAPAGGEYRSALSLRITGELLNSREHHYARAAVHLSYRTGPGMRLTAATTVRGPYRLSHVSAADAILRSLVAISAETYSSALAHIDDTWIAGVDRAGLPYQVEHQPNTDGCDVFPVFEVPPLLQHQFLLRSQDSDCDYLVDPLTGIIRIVYNGTT